MVLVQITVAGRWEIFTPLPLKQSRLNSNLFGCITSFRTSFDPKKNPQTQFMSLGIVPFLILKQILFAILYHEERSDSNTGRSSDFRIILLTTPSRPILIGQWHLVVFVPDYSGGPTPDLHWIPSCSLSRSCIEYVGKIV